MNDENITIEVDTVRYINLFKSSELDHSFQNV